MPPFSPSLESQLRLGPLAAGLFLYCFFALCLQRIALRLGERERAWWAWVPVIQILLLIRLSAFPWWCILVLLVPVVNFVLGVWMWIRISRRLNLSAAWGVLMFVPIVDLFVLAYLAFGDQLARPSPNS